MTLKPSQPVSADARLIDRLVDGELADHEWQDLLRTLDAEPAGWRRCALAVVASQAFDRALNSTPIPVPSVRRAPWYRIAGIAAGITVAFLAGFVSSRIPGGPVSRDYADPHVPSTQQMPAVAQLLPAPPERALATPTNDPSSPGLPSQPSALPEYVRRQLERQGYEVRGDRKVVSVALKDGRQVTVPVESIKYRFVGHQLH